MTASSQPMAGRSFCLAPAAARRWTSHSASASTTANPPMAALITNSERQSSSIRFLKSKPKTTTGMVPIAIIPRERQRPSRDPAADHVAGIVSAQVNAAETDQSDQKHAAPEEKAASAGPGETAAGEKSQCSIRGGGLQGVAAGETI